MRCSLSYDRYDIVTGLNYNGTRRFGYAYNANGQVGRHTDLYLGNVYIYTYDILGRLQRTDISGGRTILYNYDNVNNITGTYYKFNGSDKKTSYTYFKGGIVQNATFPNGAVKTRSLNGQAQVRPSTLTTPTGKKWSINRIYYTPNPNDTVKFTTNLMGSLIYENIDRTFGYTYDGSGNISKITDKTGTVSKDSTFVYDEANQLIRENNAYTNKTVTYTYDAGGNILKKTEYPFTTDSLDGLTGTVINYTYGNTNWKDLLTAYNGNDITYDEIGNPLTYYNGTQFTWYRGRKLETATTANGTSISYSYDDSGIRTQKTVDGVATDYFLDGSAIIAEKTGNDVKWYYYDGDGTREAIEYKGNVYYYFYNAQGDVMGLYDNNLNVVVNYTYDSWGNVVSISGSLAETLGKDNPFRYRGYYYDNDTGLYYLNSRYYDANIGRFINADGYVQTGQGLLDKNMFAYCLNNPVIFTDSTGTIATVALLVLGALGVGMLFLSGCTKSDKNDIGAKDALNFASDMSTVNQDVVSEFYIASENLINENSKNGVGKRRPHNKSELNSIIKPNKEIYNKMNADLICLDDPIMLKYGINGVHINGRSWDELSATEQQVIAENYILWDPIGTSHIAEVYGIDITSDMAKKTIKGRFVP